MSQKPSLAAGGQALIEGVMMRCGDNIGIAVRKPSAEIITKKEKVISLTKKYKALGMPFVRGMIILFETMVIGMRALNFSAEAAMQEDDKPEKNNKLLAAFSFGFSIVFSIFLAIFLFKFVPLFATEKLTAVLPALKSSTVLFNLTDGLIRIFIFFLYIFSLSLFPSFRRVFEYHGAEHKTIFAYEAGMALTAENIKPKSPRHPRCGTSFIIFVLIISIVALSFVPKHPVFWIHLLRRLAVLPLIAGISYELLKWTAKREKNPIIKLLTLPGIWTQYITTKEPDEKQIEVAVAALKEALPE